MRFQHQQKGLFTFYREQQLFQEQIKQLKQQLKKENSQVKRPPRRKSNTTALSTSANTHKIVPQSNPVLEDSPGGRESKCKRYGDAVAVFDRKETEVLISKKTQSPSKEEMGCYLQNKNLSFDINSGESPPRYAKLKSHSKRKEKMRTSQYRPLQGRRSTKLPSLAKPDKLDDIHPPQYKNMYSGSLIRSHGNELLRQIRSKVKGDTSFFKEDKQMVSYFQFSRDYEKEHDSRKQKELSLEQRKLLELLGRYRR